MAWIRNSFVASLVATVGTVVTLAALGKRDTGSAAAPFNATSHMVHGDEAAIHDGVDLAHTGTGLALHTSAMVGWAVLQEWIFGRWARKGGVERAVVAGTVTSAAAYVVDYHIVPPRFTPGMEKRVSKTTVAAMYGILAATLAIGIALSTDDDEA